jgi:hypothetical protein
MGFNKRIISEDVINKHINNEKPLKNLFNVDALIFMDNISLKTYKWFINGVEIADIKKNIQKHYESRAI